MLPRSRLCGAGGATSVAAGRVSYTFGLKGPCVSVDTACSSSLVGMHYGARDVADDVCDRAVAAGVNLTLNPGKTAAFTVTGVCRQFKHLPESVSAGLSQQLSNLSVLKRHTRLFSLWLPQ